ncbi:MAG: hypothetical protein EOP49_19970 [Sphingobacteriales bacterium]|nr:MAG: hypothetical protein EOP49_19970 [Sphingobacteriales bacterium]
MRKLLLMVSMLAVLWAGAQSPVDRIEYFFNTDPGYGNGLAANFTPANNISNLNFSPDISGLAGGLNRLFARSRSSNGLWSQAANQLFFKLTPANVNGSASINRIEYFFNTDPGFGAATAVSFSASANIADLIFTPDLGGLPTGINILQVRSRDANGKWSVVASQVIYKLLPAAASTITRVEYFFNADPGTGSGNAVPLTAGTDISNLAFTPDISGLPQGINRLYVRSLDANGKWSLTASQGFYKLLPKAAAAPISRLEYFIDNDPGFGNAVPVVFYKADSIPDLSFPVNISGLNTGEHFLYVRSRDSSGKWSLAGIDTIQINSAVAAAAIIVNSLLLNPDGTPLEGFTQRISTIAALCAGNEIRMAFDPSGTYNTGNIFTIQLSNASGNFSSPINIGQVNSVKGAATLSRLPRHLPSGTGYKIRVVSSNPLIIGDPSPDEITINDLNLGEDTTVYLSCIGEVTSLLLLYNTTGLTSSWNTAVPAATGPGLYRLISNDANNCPDTAMAEIKLEVATWSGNASSDWHNASNWNINKVPGLMTHVIIPTTSSNPCIISALDANAASVQVRPGGMVGK